MYQSRCVCWWVGGNTSSTVVVAVELLELVLLVTVTLATLLGGEETAMDLLGTGRDESTTFRAGGPV